MKDFLSKTVQFFLPWIILFILFFISIVLTSKFLLKNSSHFQIKKNTDVLFAGDSHIVGSVPDSLYPNSKNIALRSETYYHTYFKLKYYMNQTKIRKVILGFSYHNLASYYDSFLNGIFSGVISTKCFFVLPLREKFRVFYWNKNKIMNFIKIIFITAYYQYHDTDSPRFVFNNGFDVFHYNTIFQNQIAKKRLKNQFFSNNNILEFSRTNIKYLNKIIELCKYQKVELILLSTPLHKSYFQGIPEIYKLKFKEFEKNNFLINLSNLSLNDSCFSPDGDHLNNNGISEFNQKLMEELNYH